MKQEDKELLLKDLCARLPYRVIVYHPDYDEPETLDTVFSPDAWDEGGIWCTIDDSWDSPHKIKYCKPYLRPMSSMTEEEKKEYQSLCEIHIDHDADDNVTYYYFDTIESFDWLNEHHFDYRGLIEKDLAIEVTDDNNPYKD